MSAKQFRELARECMQWAEEANSEEDRRHFIEMAKAWVHAAAELRELNHGHDEAPVPKPSRRRRNRTRNPPAALS